MTPLVPPRTRPPSVFRFTVHEPCCARQPVSERPSNRFLPTPTGTSGRADLLLRAPLGQNRQIPAAAAAATTTTPMSRASTGRDRRSRRGLDALADGCHPLGSVACATAGDGCDCGGASAAVCARTACVANAAGVGSIEIICVAAWADQFGGAPLAFGTDAISES